MKPFPSCCNRPHPRGRITWWLLLALAVLALLVGLWWLSRSTTQPPPGTKPQVKSPPTYDHAKANARIVGLQQQLMKVMSEHHDPAPLIAAIRAFVKTYPTDANGYTLLAQGLAYDNQTKPAYDAVINALKLDRDQPSIQAMAGTLAMKSNRPDRAAVHYAQAVSLDTSNGRYRVLLASAQIQLGEYEKAQLTLLGALRLDSSLYQARVELADLYAAQDKVTEALDQIRRAINMIPADKTAYKTACIRRRAQLLRRANRPADSLSVLQDLPLKQQFTPVVLKDMAASWAMLGQPAKAAANYEKARAFLPDNKHTIAAAIHWHLKAHQLDKAIKDLGDIRNIDPHWPRIQSLQQQINAVEKHPTTRP